MLAPLAPKIDAEPDPYAGWQLAKPAYEEACRRGIAWSMLPEAYGGGGMSNVDFVIAAEEIQAVDPGFGTTVLVNGLGLMPVWYYGTEEQKQRFIGGATSDTSNEFIVGYAASEPPGSPGGTANFDAPAIGGAGMGVTATLDGDEYVLNGRKYWPCNVGGWDNKGANLNLVVVPHGPEPRRDRGAVGDHRRARHPGDHVRQHQHLGQRTAPNFEITFDNARVPADNMIEGAKGNGDLADQPQLRLVRPGRRDRRGRGRPRRLRGRAAMGQDLHRRRPEADHPLPVPGLRPGRRGGEDRGGALLLLEDGPLPRPARLPRRDARRHVQDPLHRDAVRLRLQVHAGRRRQLRRQEAPFDRYLREAAILPLYDAGNFGMQRRRVHGVMADPSFNPRAVMDDEAIEFTKAMEGIDTIPGPTADEREAVHA